MVGVNPWLWRAPRCSWSRDDRKVKRQPKVGSVRVAYRRAGPTGGTLHSVGAAMRRPRRLDKLHGTTKGVHAPRRGGEGGCRAAVGSEWRSFAGCACVGGAGRRVGGRTEPRRVVTTLPPLVPPPPDPPGGGRPQTHGPDPPPAGPPTARGQAATPLLQYSPTVLPSPGCCWASRMVGGRGRGPSSVRALAAASLPPPPARGWCGVRPPRPCGASHASLQGVPSRPRPSSAPSPLTPLLGCCGGAWAT
eukprot:scaffold549_cov385-Prasinococcus_capsulatus_cf.AAC.25